MSIRGVRRLGDAYSDYLTNEAAFGWNYPALSASQYQQAVAANLFSFSQDPRVPNNPNPIYAPGTPQWNAAIAALSSVQQTAPAPSSTVSPAPSMNPTPAAAIPAPAASLAGYPWYYWAVGAGILALLFSGGGSRH